MRRKIHQIIEPPNRPKSFSAAYDYFMIIVIVVSLIPLNFKEERQVFILMDKICTSFFIIDYTLRWITADYNSSQRPVIAFIKYPFTVMAIIDLFAILPSLVTMNHVFRMLRLFRLLRVMRVLRVAKVIRYSKNIQLIMNVIKRSRKPLIAVGTMAIVYVYVSALIIFIAEPDTFDTMFDAIYWAVVSLTTVGYGDLYPVSDIGRVVAMISSFFGIAVVALPAGIITAGYMNELNNDQSTQ